LFARLFLLPLDRLFVYLFVCFLFNRPFIHSLFISFTMTIHCLSLLQWPFIVYLFYNDHSLFISFTMTIHCFSLLRKPFIVYLFYNDHSLFISFTMIIHFYPFYNDKILHIKTYVKQEQNVKNPANAEQDRFIFLPSFKARPGPSCLIVILVYTKVQKFQKYHYQL
jgi:hypothetical protein